MKWVTWGAVVSSNALCALGLYQWDGWPAVYALGCGAVITAVLLATDRPAVQTSVQRP